MSKQLTLILKTPVEQLIPEMLAWNNDELLANVEEKLLEYQDVIYNQTQIGQAKDDKARLNAFCKNLNDARIKIGKAYSAPYERFKSEVDEVLNRVKQVVGHIDSQITTYETNEKEKKRNLIFDYFKSVVGEFVGFINFEKIFNPRWLNVTVSMKSIKEEIDLIVSKTKEAMTTIDAFDEADRDFIRSFYFKTLDFGSAMAEYQRLKKQREDAILYKQQEERARIEAERQEALKPKESPKIAPTSHETPKVEKMVVKFGVEGTVEEIKALKEFLIKNKIKYFAI